MSKINATATHPENARAELRCSFEAIRKCPLCHVAINPNTLHAYFPNGKERLSVIYHCPSCDNLFLATYGSPAEISDFNGPLRTWYRTVLRVSPKEPELITFSDAIQTLSPDFCVIFNQASTAEASGLDDICGPGYRKALEFLVKDYLCEKMPEEAEHIQKEPLVASVRRIDDPRIRTLAERSVWLGNDETHYVRKHENLDLTDMKSFITAMLSYIEMELTFERALAVQHQR